MNYKSVVSKYCYYADIVIWLQRHGKFPWESGYMAVWDLQAKCVMSDRVDGYWIPF